jgi:hypothetical protein
MALGDADSIDAVPVLGEIRAPAIEMVAAVAAAAAEAEAEAAAPAAEVAEGSPVGVLRAEYHMPAAGEPLCHLLPEAVPPPAVLRPAPVWVGGRERMTPGGLCPPRPRMTLADLGDRGGGRMASRTVVHSLGGRMAPSPEAMRAMALAAVSGLQQQQVLPAGWQAVADPAGGPSYYIDHNTRTTHWQLPSSSTQHQHQHQHQQLHPQLHPQFQQHQLHQYQHQHQHQQLPAGWQECRTPEGQRYFFDTAARRSHWVLPSAVHTAANLGPSLIGMGGNQAQAAAQAANAANVANAAAANAAAAAAAAPPAKRQATRWDVSGA